MIDGKKVYAKAIYKDPETYFTPEVMEKLDEIAKEELRFMKNIFDEEEFKPLMRFQKVVLYFVKRRNQCNKFLRPKEIFNHHSKKEIS